jgi:hypothetical protein
VSVDEYREWCARHGFAQSLAKSRARCDREWHFALRRTAEQKLRRLAKNRNPLRWVEGIVAGAVEPGVVPEPLRQLCERCREGDLSPDTGSEAESALALFRHVACHTDLLAQRSSHGRASYAEGILALCRGAATWRRRVEEWRPRTHNATRQFSSLARHLHALWDVPVFLDAAWFESGALGRRHQEWFRHIAGGASIRTADLPIPYSKRMAHHFLRAPEGYSIEAALRLGQVIALGGDERLAEAIRGTRLVQTFEADEFWVSVLRFFVANPLPDLDYVCPIVDYLYAQRFQRREVMLPSGRPELLQPPQPNLSMRGRSVEGLLRQVENWHGALGRRGRRVERCFAPSGMRPLRLPEGSFRDGTYREWRIRELRSTSELIEEGRSLRHCVAWYAEHSAGRDCSIWSVELLEGGRKHKVLTIEVRSADGTICQARGLRNERPSERVRAILRRWAEREGLTVASHV